MKRYLTGILCVGLLIGILIIFISKVISSNNAIKDKNDVELYYNKSTGEFYPILPDGIAPHTCVWTIWGDHGSQMKLVTDSSFITEDSDPAIKINKFLPPRVPIYVTCVDWQNDVFKGTLGEYK